MEMNIVRGRGAQRKNVVERKSGADGFAALESMRMLGGNEKHCQEEQRTRQLEARGTTKRREAEKARE